MKMIITSNSVNVDENKITTVYKTGEIIELITSYHRNDSLKRIRKLNKTQYVDLETGEIKEYKQHNNRGNNIQGIQRSLATLRRLININFTGDDSERFVTLTYSTIMTDTNKLYKDFKSFISSLRKHYPVEYIAIVEPQQTGSLHLHVLLKSLIIKKLHVPIETLSELWKNGHCYIEKLPFSDNFGAYFAVKVTDLYPDTDHTGNSDVPKSIIKGGRLRFYPANFKLYRCSKGIKRPLPTKMTYGEARKLTNDMELCFSSAKQIISVDDEGNEKTLNSISYEQYKYSKKKKKRRFRCMKNTEKTQNDTPIEKIETEHNNLLIRQNEAINDLFDEFQMMFAIVKLDLSKRCSLQTMRYMLMIDVFLNELKSTVFNYKEDDYEEDMDI